MKSAFALLCAASDVVLAKEDPYWVAFTDWKDKFNHVFESAEEDLKRFGIFTKNLAKAAELTVKSSGKAQFGATKFAHLSTEEFKQRHTGFKPSANRKRPAKKTFPKLSKKSIDWRDIGGVTPVKDQGQCGSCWAFSATQAVETAFWKATNSLKVLAPQQMVSCDDSDMGCNGGDTLAAYEYVENAGGLEEESDYPYKSGVSERSGRCKSDSSEYSVEVTGSQTIAQGGSDESNMYQQIQESPMSICVDAEPWQLYMGGVVDRSTCGTDLDHCVHLVGANFDSSQGYWIVKNSWNTNWGEDGYIRVATGQNACGIAEEATIVTADDAMAKKKGLKDNTQDALDFIIGVSEGFGLSMEQKCIDGTHVVVDELVAAYAKMQEKSPVAMAEAMKMVADALMKKWPSAAAACAATKEQVEKILASLEAFSNPKAFAYHVGQDLVVNGVDIFKQMNSSVGHIKAKEWHDGGFALGTALSELIVGTDNLVYV